MHKKSLTLTLCCLFASLLLSCQQVSLTKVIDTSGPLTEASLTPTLRLPSATPSPSDTPLPSSTPTPLNAKQPTATQSTPMQSTAIPATSITDVSCLDQGGRVEVSQLSIDNGSSSLDYRLYLPPCYDQVLDQVYPVLYLVHGQSFNDDQWERLGVGEVMNRWVASGEVAPFIIAMPRDTQWGSAEQDPFDEAVLQELIPYIDQHYRTLDDRAHRAVGGLSRGAGWAANLGLQHPDLFGSVGLHSLALFWTDVPHVKQWLDDISPELMPRFYIDAGLNDRPDILKSSRWFEGLLDQRNIPHEWHLFAGYHDETYWKAHLENYLRWYAAGWSK